MLRIFMILLFISLDLLSARPAEEPTKFILGNIQNNTDNIAPSRLESTKESLERLGDAARIGRARFVNFITLARNIIASRAEQINSEFQSRLEPLTTKSDELQSRRSIGPDPSTPPVQSTTPVISSSRNRAHYRETVRLENDTAQGILEIRRPGNIREILNSFLTPKPLVDRIKDEEKYGNTGESYIEKAVVNGYENFSNFLIRLVNFPVSGSRADSSSRQNPRRVTQTLDELGARLIGLQ